MKTLTVSVAAYNVEMYLDQCLESFIIEEVLADIEVLVINDGSKDSTPTIAKKYVDRYPSVFKLINKENGGHGSTINKGIELATGKYFKVVDGDDWVDKDSFSMMVKHLKGSKADLVACHHALVDNTSGRKTIEKIEDVKYGFLYRFEDVKFTTTVPMHSINYKTSLLRNNRIRIDEKLYYVDVEYILMPIPFVKTIEFLDLIVYMYRVGNASQSISYQSLIRNCGQHETVIFKLIGFLNTSNVDALKYRYIFNRILSMIEIQYFIYTYFSPLDNGAGRARKFDDTLKTMNIELYKASQIRNTSLRYMRLTGFIGVKYISVKRIIKEKVFSGKKEEKNAG